MPLTKRLYRAIRIAIGLEEPFAPDLIDLVEYEKELLYQKSRGVPLRPPPNVTKFRGGWTVAELQAIADNRSEANAIRERIEASEI